MVLDDIFIPACRIRPRRGIAVGGDQSGSFHLKLTPRIFIGAGKAGIGRPYIAPDEYTKRANGEQ